MSSWLSIKINDLNKLKTLKKLDIRYILKDKKLLKDRVDQFDF